MGRGSPLRLLLPILGLLALAAPVRTEPVSPVPAPSQLSQSPAVPASGPTDTASDASADTSLANKPKSRSDSVIVVKHSFDHREQIITGSVVMTCLMMMMVAMNNYNPR
jgi:hypothetical protein